MGMQEDQASENNGPSTRSGRTGKGRSPLPARAKRESPSPAKGRGAKLESDPSNYQAGRGRRVQVTERGRERFDKVKRATFLEWFAATCNAQLAAREAGGNYRTPYRTRMRDTAFAE